MYIDGHECKDVVAYQNTFVARWAEYEKHMVHFDNDGNEQPITQGFNIEQCGWFCLILVTHDESTFFAEDRHKNTWHAPGVTPTPEQKREGESLMVSDFLTSEWGPLHDDEEYALLSTHQIHSITPMYSEAHIFFRASKNHDGFFDNDDLL
jgi:hypothetical protein